MTPQCQNCGHLQAFLYAVGDENRGCSNETFHWFRCETCGVISLGDPPANLDLYYGGGYYAIPDARRLEALAARESAKVDAFLPYIGSGRLLEIGPAVGVFAHRAHLEGFDVTVIERDARCCEHLKMLGTMTVVHAEEPVAAMAALPQFDVIALWHVIEHLRAPFRFLAAAAQRLRPGGVLVLATPNPGAWQFATMGKHWPHLDAPRHLHLLPAQAVASACREAGLEVLRLVSDDQDARRWNRFGWQRLLMNRLPGKVGQAAGFVVGAALATVVAPFESGQLQGSAYTLTLRKVMESTGRQS